MKGFSLLKALGLGMLWLQGLSLSTAQVLPVFREVTLVTANGWPEEPFEVNRDVWVLTREDIQKLPAAGLSDLLQYVNGLYLRARGPLDIQGDVATRGGSFEQVLVLINGMPVNDPQTGHFNLNLPIGLEDIERVEISRGPSLHLYGARAMAGLINIVTRRTSPNTWELGAGQGEFGRWEASARLGRKFARGETLLSGGLRQSQGYRPNTDFQHWWVNNSFSWNLPKGQVSLFAGLFQKDFGANSFYSERFPRQWEANRGALFTLGAWVPLGHGECGAQLGWRRHQDRFLLDRDAPSFYQNRHKNHSLTGNLSCSWVTSWGKTLLGTEWARHGVTSTRLGEHLRQSGGVHFLQALSLTSKLDVSGGGTLRRENGRWFFWPSLDAGMAIHQNWRLFVASGWAYRSPSLTELYYQDPANQGNPHLQPERAWSLEAGLRHRAATFSFSLGAFYRRHKEMIDWVRNSPAEAWRAVNLGGVRSQGFHWDFSKFLDWDWSFATLRGLSVGFTSLRSSRLERAPFSKYVFSQLNEQAIVQTDLTLAKKANVHLVYRFEAPQAWPSRELVDLRISLPALGLEWILDVTNLFNEHYQTFPGVVMPGRWAFLGVRLEK
jgi:iron complex outermembrane receptor protein